MNYSIKQLNEFMRRIQENEEMIRIDRGLRYGAPDDTLSNVAEFGADGAIVAFWECARRIRNMYGKEKDLADLENAVMDGRNYLAYILCLETREQDVHVCACAEKQPEPMAGPPVIGPWTNPLNDKGEVAQ